MEGKRCFFSLLTYFLKKTKRESIFGPVEFGVFFSPNAPHLKVCFLGPGDLSLAGFVLIIINQLIPSLKLTYPQIDPWKRKFLLETIIFRGDLLVSGRVIALF